MELLEPWLADEESWRVDLDVVAEVEAREEWASRQRLARRENERAESERWAAPVCAVALQDGE